MSTLGHRLGESDGHALPDTTGAPAPEASIDRVPFPVFLRHITPRRTGAQPPQDAVDDVAVVLGRPPATPFSRLPFNRQQNLQRTPLDLRQIAAAQGCLLESAALNQNEIQASMILSTRPSKRLASIAERRARRPPARSRFLSPLQTYRSSRRTNNGGPTTATLACR